MTCVVLCELSYYILPEIVVSTTCRNVSTLQPMKTMHRLFLTVVSLSIIGFKSQAVIPPPDGDYPGGNTAEGHNALFSLSSGAYNTAVGFLSLRANTTNNFNTAIGAGALLANTADGNTAAGTAALLSNTTGTQNTAVGELALLSNTVGGGNTAVGSAALSNNSSNYNTAMGSFALNANTSGFQNAAFGSSALSFNQDGFDNTAVGSEALSTNTAGQQNTGVGAGALLFNSTGADNTAIGHSALFHNTVGGQNTSVGISALGNNTSGSNNIALGTNAGLNSTTGNYNIDIGNAGVAGETGTIRIGDENHVGATFIAGIYGMPVSGLAVVMDSSGHLGTTGSSSRFKKEIRPMAQASEAILALKPVTFRYKKKIDPTGTAQFGLVAEEVEKVDPDLVVRDKDRKPYTVRYDAVNAMLLNEFLKEHRAFLEEQAKVERLEKQVGALAAGFQKMSAHLETTRTAPQTAANNR